jgi:hypothetical protein
MNKWLFIVLLLVGATILGATALRDPIARASQIVDANVIAPLDRHGDLRVHEQGTSTVRVESSAADPVTVRDLDTPAQPFEDHIHLQVASGTQDCGTIPVPAGNVLVIEHVSVLLTAPVDAVGNLWFEVEDDQVARLFAIPLTRIGALPTNPSIKTWAASEPTRAYADPSTPADESVVRACMNMLPNSVAGITFAGHQ